MSQLSKEDAFFQDLEAYCQELRPIEELCYLEQKQNGAIVELAKKYNLLGILVPEEFGGRGISMMDYIDALERIGEEGTGIRTLFSVHTGLAQQLLMDFGSDHLKEHYLRPSTKGEMLLAFALTEPEAGSNPLGMTSTFEDKGDHFELNGVKYLISNSGISDAMIVFAKDVKDDRISAFIMDSKDEAVTHEALHAKMGTFTTNTGMFEMKHLRLPKENLLGELGQGWHVAKFGLLSGRLSVAAGCVGTTKDCLKEAVSYAKSRKQHGKEIGKHQLIQEHIALMKIDLDASRALVHKAAEAKLALMQDPGNKDLFKEADMLISEAKFFAAKASFEAADRAVQVYGGRGWSYLFRPGRHLVDSRVTRIYEGSEEIMKLKIALGVLGDDFKAFS